MSIQGLDMETLDKVSGGDMSDIGEMRSLSLQMYMDKKSQLMEMISNFMKKEGSTAGQVVANLK
jgi:hypothetical protein